MVVLDDNPDRVIALVERELEPVFVDLAAGVLLRRRWFLVAVVSAALERRDDNETSTAT